MMNKVTVTEINLMRKIAWSFHLSTNIEFGDLFSEAFIAYQAAVKSFNESKSKQSTWAWYMMRNHLINYTHRENKHHFRECIVDELPPVIYDPQSFEEFLETLPPECMEIAKVLLNNLDQFDDNPPPRYARGRIAKLLKKEGWTGRKIWESMQLFKDTLTETTV